jgi:hypothetical protein
VLFVAESRVVADDGVHLVWVGVVTFYKALVLDHGRCWRMRQQWQAVLLADDVVG